MSDPDPLLEWNRLNKENSEHDIASAMFISMANTSPVVDKFSMWLFAGTGATGALLITQINSVLPSMSITGFRACMFMLIGSSIFAFIAKYFALRCQIQNEITAMFTERADVIFAGHEKNEERIEEIARERGIEIETDINFSNVIKEYVRPFPKWVQWLVNRSTQKNEGDRQAGHHLAVKAYYKQLRFTFLQALMFIGFMCAGGWYAGGL
jgi:hypothetical protein